MNNGMRLLFLLLVSMPLLTSFSGRSDEVPGAVRVSAFGKQPAVAVDDKNVVHVVFGSGNDIHYSFSKDGGATFSPAQRVGQQEKLALGASRGPQIAVTSEYVVVAAADHTGRILVYRRKRSEDQWSGPSDLLHGEVTAKEGFVTIAAGEGNEVVAAWLDLRQGNGNNIFGARSKDAGKTWSENTLVYASPEGKVCPCCRPSIAADTKGTVCIMFRNEWRGARDLYLVRSGDSGKTYGKAEKLGTGTWMLQQCPMDGGAIDVGDGGTVGTTWRRDDAVYYAEPGNRERKIGTGRVPSLVKSGNGDYIAWQEDSRIMTLTPAALSAEAIGTGSYPRLASGPRNAVFCVWESAEGLFAKKLN